MKEKDKLKLGFIATNDNRIMICPETDLNCIKNLDNGLFEIPEDAFDCTDEIKCVIATLLLNQMIEEKKPKHIINLKLSGLDIDAYLRIDVELRPTAELEINSVLQTDLVQ
jgi:hypothetical protein